MNTASWAKRGDIGKLIIGVGMSTLFAAVLALAGWVGSRTVEIQTQIECQEIKIKHNEELIKELKANSKEILAIVREIQRDLYSSGICIKYKKEK